MNRYPTDEELNSFIEELEKEKLYAPLHLKEEILLKVKEGEQPAKTGSKSQQPVSLFLYTLKMVAGMAAAVLLIFMIPAENGSDVSKAGLLEKDWSISGELSGDEYRERISLDERISEHVSQKREEASNALDGLFQKIGNLFNVDSVGGDYYEN